MIFVGHIKMKKAVKSNVYSEFDSQEFCRSRYGVTEQPGHPPGQQTLLMNTLSEIYNKGEINGLNLLDFGTGPSIYNLISAARHFQNIYLSDYSENNRDALWRWLTNKPDAHNFSDFFQYVADKENRRKPWETLEKDMRSRIKGILACDMTLEQPLLPCRFPQFDVISSSLCLSVVPGMTIADFEIAIKNVVSLLKPGGWVIYLDGLGCSRYQIGKLNYDVLSLTKDDVINGWKKAGCEPKSWVQHHRSPIEIANSPLDDSTGFFCMTAQKV